MKTIITIILCAALAACSTARSDIFCTNDKADLDGMRGMIAIDKSLVPDATGKYCAYGQIEGIEDYHAIPASMR